MGKLGACELNYWSDIDLVLFIDETSPAISEPYECVDTFSRLGAPGFGAYHAGGYA